MCVNLIIFLVPVHPLYCCEIITVNYFGMIRCCKAFLPLFKRQSIEDTHKGGRIINITSMAGYISNGVMGMSAYSASKHAANAFSHVLRTELISSYNVQVCTINPSFHKTPLVDTMDPVLAKTWEDLDPTLKYEYGEGTVKERVHYILQGNSTCTHSFLLLCSCIYFLQTME